MRGRGSHPGLVELAGKAVPRDPAFLMRATDSHQQRMHEERQPLKSMSEKLGRIEEPKTPGEGHFPSQTYVS